VMRILLGVCLTLGGGGVILGYLLIRKYHVAIDSYKRKCLGYWGKWD
jgi:hypothetical protein